MRCCDFCKEKKPVAFKVEYTKLSDISGETLHGSKRSFEMCKDCGEKFNEWIKMVCGEK